MSFCTISPSQEKGASGRTYHSSGGTDIDELALDARRVSNIGAALQDNSVDDMNFCSELHDVENLLKVVYLDTLSNGILLQVCYCDSTLFFADEGHEVVLFL